MAYDWSLHPNEVAIMWKYRGLLFGGLRKIAGNFRYVIHRAVFDDLCPLPYFTVDTVVDL